VSISAYQLYVKNYNCFEQAARKGIEE